MRAAFLLSAVLMFCVIPLSAAKAAWTDTTPLISFGVGAFDIMENVEQDKSIDFRAEYRFGDPLFSVVKPFMGLETTADGAGAAFGGVVADIVIADHYVIAPSFGLGLWSDGGGKTMGTPLEFRSQIEAGYRFDNGWRLTGAFSHISNAGNGHKNPGVEIGTLYIHIPADRLLPQ